MPYLKPNKNKRIMN